MAAATSTGQLYPFARGLIRPATTVVWPVDIEGLEHLPPKGGAIIAPNHISFLDSVVLIGVLPRRITYVGKAEYLDNWKTRFLFPAVGMIPIDRTGGKSSVAALDTAARVLESGQLFGIFPEGTRSRDGLLYRGRTGIARLALRTGAPVVPVGIVGTDRIQPPGASVPRPFRRCAVRFGEPIAMDHYAGRDGDGRIFRELTDEIMFEIATLSGQQYVDRYADRKAGGDGDAGGSRQAAPAGSGPPNVQDAAAISGAAGA
jgi:1-acyl-sn-glycerol-3-phosphate acyltransferase